MRKLAASTYVVGNITFSTKPDWRSASDSFGFQTLPSGPVNVIFDASATDTGAVKSSPIGRTGMHWPFAFVRWQLNFAVLWKYNGNEQHEQASFGVLNGDWSPRPAYIAIQNMPKN